MHQIAQQQQHAWGQPQHSNHRSAQYMDSELQAGTTAPGVPPHYNYSQQQVLATSIQQEQAVPLEWVSSDIGNEFVIQYFRTMKTMPENLPKFYSADAHVSRIHAFKDSFTYKHAKGTVEITQILYNEHVGGTRVSVAYINTISCQDSVSGGLFLQASGKLIYVNETSRNFVISILLLRQPIGTGVGYIVMNDVMVLEQESVPSLEPDSYPVGQEPHEALASSASPQPHTQQQLQQHHLQQPQTHQQPLDHRQPVHHDQHQLQQEQQLQQQQQKLQLPRQNPQEQETQKSQLEQQRQVQVKMRQQPTSFEASLCPSPSETTNSSSLSPLDDILNAPFQETAVGAKVTKLVDNRDQASKKENDNQNSKTEETSAPTVQKPSAWQTKPVSKLENSDLGSFDPDSKENVQSVTAKQAAAAKNSYAAALLQSKPSTPCPAGYSVPGPDQARAETMAQQQESSQEGKKNGKATASQQRSKTVWVSYLPHDMPEEKIQKAVCDQLKGQETEGHAVRVSRVPGHSHGYIELDTEMCAKILVKQGLHFQGREVAVNFANQTGSHKFSKQRSSFNKKYARGNTYNKPSDDYHEETKRPSQFAPSNNFRNAVPQREQQQSSPSVQEGWTAAHSRRKTKPKDAGSTRSPNANSAFSNYKKNSATSAGRPKPNRLQNDSSAYTVAQTVN